MCRQFYVYILSSPNRNVLYIGVTNDLHRRLYEHRKGLVKGFTKRYRVNELLHVETFDTAQDAILREKQLKGWTINKKLTLIIQRNPDLADITAKI